MTAQAPGRGEVEARIRNAVRGALGCDSHLSPCPDCEDDIAAVMDAADAYAGAAQERPAPELRAVLADRHDLSTLNAWQGAEIGRLRELLNEARIAEPLTVKPSDDVPRELAAAMAESRQLLGWLDEATRAMLNLGTRPAEVNLAHRLRKQAGLAP